MTCTYVPPPVCIYIKLYFQQTVHKCMYITKISLTIYIRTYSTFVCDIQYSSQYVHMYSIQSNVLSKYLEGHSKSVLLIRGSHYRYWVT